MPSLPEWREAMTPTDRWTWGEWEAYIDQP